MDMIYWFIIDGNNPPLSWTDCAPQKSPSKQPSANKKSEIYLNNIDFIMNEAGHLGAAIYIVLLMLEIIIIQHI